MRVVRFVKRKRQVFTTTGIASVCLRPWQPVSAKLPLARSIAFRLALRSAQLECFLKNRGTVPKLVRVINVAIKREGHELTVAITVQWRCVRGTRRCHHCADWSRRAPYSHQADYSRGSRYAHYGRGSRCGRYNCRSQFVCPYFYSDCWSCPRRRDCVLIDRPKLCTLARQIAIAIKRNERLWRRSYAHTPSGWQDW